MKIKKELIKRDIAGDTILVPVGKTVYDSNGLFVLNELGTFIWDILPQAENEAEICRAVLAEYDVSAEEAAADIAEFMARLKELGIL
ncbi:MAG: PqqD family protein [Oscillospiraceae bacterium]|nr:PqqD family protein [Oscillospiraceae bacterium]